jgi:hypothetical protein
MRTALLTSNAMTQTTAYQPPSPPNEKWREAAEEYADQGKHGIDDFDWYFDLQFPVFEFHGPPHDDDSDLWKVFNEENTAATEERLYNAPPDNQYYDGYWGWWTSDDAVTGRDCPIVVFGDEKGGENGWDTWDGWHRMLIARLARVKRVPAIVGIRREN